MTVRVMRCPDCGLVSSVAPWCVRPICVHAWDGMTPEIWDGDSANHDGSPIEQAPNVGMRTPGPKTWTEMEAEWRDGENP
jgi:hypothetical protein